MTMVATSQHSQRRPGSRGPATASPLASAETPVRTRRRVYIVDDHQLFVVGLSVLINDSADMEVCGTGHEEGQVLRDVRRLRPDLVILDVKLRHIDGFEVARALRRLVGEVPILFLSSLGDSQKRQMALYMGARGFLEKTQEPGLILEGIRRALTP